MQKYPLLVSYILFLFFSQIIYAKPYCIYIDTIPLSLNTQQKIYTLFDDLAYPSYKISQKHHIKIYTGEFKSVKDAKKLLSLTKSRYPKAEVADCKDTIIYQTHSKLSQKYFIEKKITQKKIEPKLFTLKLYEAPLSQSVQEKTKIRYMLKKLPQSFTRIKGDNFFVYSGKFSSLESAKVILSLVRQEFPAATITAYPKKVKLQAKEQMFIQKNNLTTAEPLSERVVQSNISLLNRLNEKGYIPKNIGSKTQKEIESHNQAINMKILNHAFDKERTDTFNGLYLKLNAAWDTLNSTTAYDARLEFDIFDQGYFQIKKKNEKNRLNNKITFLKAIKSIDILKKQQEELKIKKYSNTITLSATLLKLKVLETTLQNAQKKLENGLITHFEYDTFLLSIQNIKDELLLLKQMTLLKIPSNLLTLLNQIERVRLADETTLMKMLRENNVDFKLANTLQDQTVMQESWSDKLRVNIYAGQRRMYLSQDQSLIGLEAKIPLSGTDRQDELNFIQGNILKEQAAHMYNYSIEMLKQSIANFRYKQQKIKTYSYELSKIKEHLKELNIINNSAYASYAKINIYNEESVINSYFSNYILIEKERLNAYKELINIIYLIHAEGLKDILLYAID